MQFSTLSGAVYDSPIGAAYTAPLPAGVPLLDLAQAQMCHPPHEAVAERLRRAADDPLTGRYVDVNGLQALRAAFAREVGLAYATPHVGPDHVVVTAGCNQAYALVVAAIADPGDELVVADPYYYSHVMWPRLTGVRTRLLACGPAQLPDPDAAAELVNARTRAIVIVSPGNPTGVTVPPRLLARFADLARSHGVALVLDETYRSFRDDPGAPHEIFRREDWADTLISLHSFSKDFALAGYRVGAVVGSEALAREVCKHLDCTSVCASRIGQEVALEALRSATAWRAERACELAAARDRAVEALAPRPGGYEVVSSGGMFVWVRHPHAAAGSADVARRLASEHAVLTVPGTAFSADGEQMLRVSVGNLAGPVLAELVDRLDRDGARVAA